jgi:hypothetical protein
MARLLGSSLPVSIKRVQAGSAASASSASHSFQSRSLCAKAAQGAHISKKAIEGAFITVGPDLPIAGYAQDRAATLRRQQFTDVVESQANKFSAR